MKPLYKIISILILSGLLFYAGRCSKNCISITTNDRLQYDVDSITMVNQYLDVAKSDLLAQVSKQDSTITNLKTQKPILTKRYAKAKQGRSEITSDSLADLVIFDQVTSSCDSLSALNDSIIAQQEYRDTALLAVIDIQKQQLDNKDVIIADQAKTIDNVSTQVNKLEKKVRRNRVIAGIASAVSIIIAVF